jgi:hypothetical protein
MLNRNPSEKFPTNLHWLRPELACDSAKCKHYQ